MPGTAISRFASLSTMMALLPPSSSSHLPIRAATRSPTLRPTAQDPVNDTRSMRVSSTKLRRKRVVGIVEYVKDVRQTRVSQGLVADFLNCNRAQRGLGRWLPDVDVAANRGNARVPRPDRDRKVECGDRADDSQGVPLLIHPVQRPLRVHGFCRRASATGPPQSRRCRSSPAPRRRLPP